MSPLPQDPLGQIDVEPVIEQEIDEKRGAEGDGQGFEPPFQFHDLAEAECGKQGHCDIAEEGHEQDPETEGGRHGEEGPQIAPLERENWDGAAQTREDVQQSEKGEGTTEKEWIEPRAWFFPGAEAVVQRDEEDDDPYRRQTEIEKNRG